VKASKKLLLQLLLRWSVNQSIKPMQVFFERQLPPSVTPCLVFFQHCPSVKAVARNGVETHSSTTAMKLLIGNLLYGCSIDLYGSVSYGCNCKFRMSWEQSLVHREFSAVL